MNEHLGDSLTSLNGANIITCVSRGGREIGLWNLKCGNLAIFRNTRIEKGKSASNLETNSMHCEVASYIKKLTKDALGKHKRTEIVNRETKGGRHAREQIH